MDERIVSHERSTRGPTPLISLVVPVRDEEACVGEFVQRARKVLEEAAVHYEILFVDDGSRDRTAERITLLRASNEAVKLLRFTRSFGQQAALVAGMRHARGDAVVTMDGDLQHPPEVLPQLLAAWRHGAAVVHASLPSGHERSRGWRAVRSRVFYRAMVALSAMPNGTEGSDFRLLDRRVVDRFNALSERIVFVRALVPWLGFPEARVEYEPAERLAGRTKYGIRKEALLAADGFFSFSRVPLRAITLTGGGLTGAGLLATLALGVAWGVGAAEPSLAAGLLLAIVVLGGLQLVAIGLVGEYVGRTHEEVKGRPRYVIDDAQGIELSAEQRSGHSRMPPPL